MSANTLSLIWTGDPQHLMQIFRILYVQLSQIFRNDIQYLKSGLGRHCLLNPTISAAKATSAATFGLLLKHFSLCIYCLINSNFLHWRFNMFGHELLHTMQEGCCNNSQYDKWDYGGKCQSICTGIYLMTRINRS